MSSQYVPQTDRVYAAPAGRAPRGGSRGSFIPGITFEELERIKLSGPTAFSSPSQVVSLARFRS